MERLEDYVIQRRPLPWEGIVDMHAHLGNWVKFPIFGGDAASLVESMDRVGVEKIMCSCQGVVSGEVLEGNETVLKGMAAYPGRVLGYAAPYPVSSKLGVDEVKRCIDKGMVGIKMHEGNKIPYTSEKYKPIWRYADRLNLPVLLHTWGDLDAMEPVFKEYQGARILLGHSGSLRPELYVEYTEKYSNLYLDLTYSRSKYHLVEYFVENVSASRVVFGSDIPWMPLGHQIGKVVFADLTEDQKRKILVENPAEILAGRV